jgi:quinol monooxygenase YgiN
MISVIARLPLQEGKADEFTEAFKEIAAGVATEPGNHLYSLNFSKKEPDVAIIMERYDDKEALAFHGETDHYKAFGPKIKDLLAGKPEVAIMDELLNAE